jgi:hypothetical protein
MNRRPKVEDTEPWYRQFWPWFLIAIPMMSVVVGITMLALAVKEPLAMVVDDYARIGLATHQRLARDERATALGLTGELAFEGEPARVEVVLSSGSAVEWPSMLLLTIAHPTLAEQDLRLELVGGDGTWRGSLPAAPDTRRYVQLEPPSGEWRLAGELAGGQRRLALGALPAAQ